MDALASGAILARTNDAVAYGEVAWSWRSDAGAKSWSAQSALWDDGGNQAWSPGRSRISRKAIAQGRRMIRLYLWFCRVLLVAREPWVRWAPGLPCALYCERAGHLNNSDAFVPRERGGVC
jgi:hypothetical protein